MRSLAVIVLVVLTGCSLHQPVQVNLSTALPDQYASDLSAAETATQGRRWWEVFADAQLKTLMDELFRQNLQLEQGFARLQQARASLRIADSARFPSLSGAGEAGRTMQPTAVGDFTGDSSQMALAASFEVDLWGKLAARSEAAAKSYAAHSEELQTLYLGLSAQLAELYYLAVEQRAQVQLTHETIRSFEETLARVETRYRMGLVPAVDVYQARQNLGAAQASQHLFAANLAAAEHALAVLVGRYPQQGLAGELAALPKVGTLTSTGVPSELVGRRPDLRAALRQVEAADAAVAAAIADRFPSINLLGRYGETRQEISTGLLSGDFWSLLGSLTLPIVDAGRRRAEVERTEAVVREAVARYQQLVLEAFREVEDALVRNLATEQRIQRLEETVAATEASQRLSLQSYLSGVTDYLPVLTAQRNHFDAQNRLLSARRQLVSERISLARSLGGSWMEEQMARRMTSAYGEDHE